MSDRRLLYLLATTSSLFVRRAASHTRRVVSRSVVTLDPSPESYACARLPARFATGATNLGHHLLLARATREVEKDVRGSGADIIMINYNTLRARRIPDCDDTPPSRTCALI